MKDGIIFYGYGNYARQHYDEWISQGLIPLCICDKDTRNKGREVRSLKEALSEYPEATFVITTRPNIFYEIKDYLVLNGVPEDRISTPWHSIAYDSSPKYCRYLLKYLVIDRKNDGTLNFSSCCLHQGMSCAINEETETLINIIPKYRYVFSRLWNDLQRGKPTGCDGCCELHTGKLELPENIDTINFSTGISGGDSCNFKCIYCSYADTLKHKTIKNAKANLGNFLSEANDLFGGRALQIYYAAGELCVSPYREKILDIWYANKWGGMILSNCSIYNDKISKIVNSCGVTLNCSLDCGTRESFKTIKGVDCFEKVKDNLRMYSRYGCIELKYILIDKLNCNHDDVFGFVNFANEIHAHVNISLEYNAYYRRMNDNEVQAVKLFINEMKLKDISFTIQYNFFNENDVPMLKHFCEL